MRLDSLRESARSSVGMALFSSTSYLKAKRSGAARFGRHGWMRGKVHFKISGTATIGDYFHTEGEAAPIWIKVSPGASLSIGDSVYMNSGVSVEAWHEVNIGSHVLMAPFASVIDDNRHEVEPGAPLHRGPTNIGNNVWLGRNVAVMPGVTIGDGSVVAANSVVTRDIPPNSLAAGSPANVIRKLDVPADWARH